MNTDDDIREGDAMDGLWLLLRIVHGPALWPLVAANVATVVWVVAGTITQ